MLYDVIIGIDPGKNGAISVSVSGKISVYKMPGSAKEIDKLFKSLEGKNKICFIEKVGAFLDDSPSQKYGIIKLLRQAERVLTLLEVNDIKIIEVAPLTWQSVLKLKRIKGEKKTARKRRYWEFATKISGEKFLIPQGDSVCILYAGKRMIKTGHSLLSGNIHNEIEELF